MTEPKLCRDTFCAVPGPHLWHGDPGDFARLVRASKKEDGTMIEPTNEMVQAYHDAWHTTPQGAPGDRTRAGLRAALNLLPTNDFTRAAAAHAVTEGTDEWNDMIEVWETLPNEIRAKLLESR